jgi:hypothetical protein
MIKVTLPYDPVWTALDWVKAHCPSYITNQSGTARIKAVPGGWINDASTDYFFSEEKDAVFFSLRWVK